MKQNGSTKRQCDRALALNPPPNHCVCEGVTVSAWRSGPSGLHAGTHEPVWDIGAGRSEKYRFTQGEPLWHGAGVLSYENPYKTYKRHCSIS
jgi:hypothetical protein